MANIGLKLMIRRRWWVPAYFAAMRVFIICWSPFADGGEMANWIDREVARLIRHGYRFEVTGG